MSPQPLRTNWPVKTKSIDCDRIKKDGWLTDGILVIKRDEPGLTWDQIFMIDKLGESLFGTRKRD